jgi:hypothetical protein
MAESVDAELEATLTDDEGGSEASDSEYGLSDRQLEEIWQQFKADGSFEVALDDGDTAGSQDHRLDAEFGLSEEQIAFLGRNCKPGEDPLRPFTTAKVDATPKPIMKEAIRVGNVQDPLQHFLKERRKSADEQTGSSCETQQQARRSLLEEQLPPRRPLAPIEQHHLLDRRREKAVLVSSREKSGRTWYLFRIYDNGEERLFLKRYSDFKRLHASLLDEASLSRRNRPVPELPESGLFGLRQKLDLGDFKARRQSALQRYVAEICNGITSISDDPILKAFFGKVAPGRVYRNFHAPLKAGDQVDVR